MPTTKLRSADSLPGTFLRLTQRLGRNGLRTAWTSNKVRLLGLLATSSIVALFVFALSWWGFYQLYRLDKIPIKGAIVAGLFDLMFFTLGGMLLISTGIILYASLFTSPESKFLLCTPARADRVFGMKFANAISFSSWAFLILGLPILISYGMVAGVPWFYYPLLPIFLIGYILLPCAVSASVCLIFVRFAPRNRKQLLIVLATILLILVGIWSYRLVMSARESLQTMKRNEVEGLLGQFALVRSPLMPSHWMTNGIMAASRGEASTMARSLAMLWSNGLMMYLLGAFLAKRFYRTAYDRIAGSGQKRKVHRGRWIDTLMEWSVSYLDKPTRILVVKDFRMFRRDPTQWVLLTIFGAMILVGGTTFRQYYNADIDAIDRYIIGLMNLFGVAVLLCAGLSRFIFPLISLEGRKFWILGLMPLSRQQILRGKFAFAVTGSLLIAVGLTVGGELLLRMPIGPLMLHTVTAICLAIGLSGLNVGLGAYMPNFRETDPSKIVAGFSGTINMVLGLGFIIVAVGVLAMPMHIAVVLRYFNRLPSGEMPWWAYAGLPIGIALTALATWLPLRAGAKALEETEF